MKTKKIIVIAALLLSASLLFAAADIDEPGMIDVRSLGMGGMHATDTTDFYTILKNPAGLGLTGPKTMITVVSANIGGPLEKLPDVLEKYQAGEEPMNIAAGLLEEGAKLNFGVGLDGPLCFGSISKNGFGWGFFESVKVDALIPSVTLARLTAQLEAGLVFGYAYALDFGAGSSLSVGATAEGYALVPRLAVQDSLVNIISLATGEGANSGSQFDDIPINTVVGLSCDLGVQLRLFNFIDAAVVWDDVYSVYKSSETTFGEAMADYSVLFANFGDLAKQESKFRVGLGLNLLPNGILGGLISSLKVQADVKDFMLFYRHFVEKNVSPLEKNPLFNIGAGAELGLMHFIFGRVGFSEGFISVGASLKIGALHLDAALYTKELGLNPGENSQMNAAVSFGLYY
ncbi:MAG: hypothetical protein K5930_04470 [Treponemataceae bacterium]|nr:hypothetical protein [Treponemataceae bacterium]